MSVLDRVVQVDMVYVVQRTASALRTALIGTILALAPFSWQLPASAQTTRPIAQLMPPLSEEEEELELAGVRRLLGQATTSGPMSELLAALQKQPKPSRELGLRNLLERMMGTLEGDYPATRAIPIGKIIEAKVSVRLPGGMTIGPYRMYSSLSQGHAPYEYANGVEYGIADRPLPVSANGLPTLDTLNSVDMMYHDADGGERFMGAMLGSVGADGTLGMNFALIVDGQPMRVVRAAARSGASVQAAVPGGYVVTIRPVLRDQAKIEARWHQRGKEQIEAKAKLPLNTLRRINPEWPGPVHVRSGPLYLLFLANAKIVCSDWKTRFSNDPAADVGKMTGQVTLTFNADGEPKIAAPMPAEAFAAGVFPAGLASDQVGDTQKWPTSVNHLGRSPALADALDFYAVDEPSPYMTWERVRREEGIVYRTRFFLRCRKQPA